MAGALAILGLGLQTYGTIKSMFDSSKAEKENAKFYREQARMASGLADRKMELLANNQRQFNSRKIATIAKSGISLSSSAFATIAGDMMEQEKERISTRTQLTFDIKRYTMEASNSQRNASTLNTLGFLQGGGQLLTGTADLMWKDKVNASMGEG